MKQPSTSRPSRAMGPDSATRGILSKSMSRPISRVRRVPAETGIKSGPPAAQRAHRMPPSRQSNRGDAMPSRGAPQVTQRSSTGSNPAAFSRRSSKNRSAVSVIRPASMKSRKSASRSKSGRFFFPSTEKCSASSATQAATRVRSRSSRMPAKCRMTSEPSMRASPPRPFRENSRVVSEKGSRALAKRFLLRRAPLAMPVSLPKSSVRKVRMRSDSP